MTWMSKAGRGGIAHFVIEGESVCAPTLRACTRGVSQSFVPLRAGEHLCYHCQRLHPEVCACGLCRASAA